MLQIRNSAKGYGAVAIILHWAVAFTVVGTFALGYWMVDLDYYDQWYKRAPDIHRSVGILLFATMVLRLIWRLFNRTPDTLPTHSRLEVLAAHGVHFMLYALIFVAMVSGYLISTANGSGINVFGWFTVPSVTGEIDGMEDVAGEVHYWATWALVGLAGLHALAALKHHVSDRDETLKRMLAAPRGTPRSGK